MNINTTKRKNNKTAFARRMAKKVADKIVQEKTFLYRYRNLINKDVMVTTGDMKGDIKKVLYMKNKMLFFETDNPKTKVNKKTKKETIIHDKTHISNVMVIITDNGEEKKTQTVNRFIKSTKVNKS